MWLKVKVYYIYNSGQLLEYPGTILQVKDIVRIDTDMDTMFGVEMDGETIPWNLAIRPPMYRIISNTELDPSIYVMKEDIQLGTLEELL